MTIFYKLTNHLKVWLQRQLDSHVHFYMLWYCTSCSFWKIPLYTHGKLRVKGAKQRVSVLIENNTDPLKGSQGPTAEKPLPLCDTCVPARSEGQRNIFISVSKRLAVTGTRLTPNDCLMNPMATGTRLTLNDCLMNQWNGNNLLTLQGGGWGVGKTGGEGERGGGRGQISPIWLTVYYFRRSAESE